MLSQLLHQPVRTFPPLCFYLVHCPAVTSWLHCYITVCVFVLQLVYEQNSAANISSAINQLEILSGSVANAVPLDILCTVRRPGLGQQQCVWTSTGKSPVEQKYQTVIKESSLTLLLMKLCSFVTAVQWVSVVCTCADRLFLFRLFSFLLRRTPVSLERPKPLLTLDSLDWVVGATASPRLIHFFS